MLEVYRCNGDARLLTAAQNYWQSLQDTQISITGSGSQFEVWQFSPDVRYQDGAGQNAMENCVTNYWIRLSRQLYWETGEEKYAQAFNRAVFNSLFAEQKPDGGDACYYQALSGTKRFGVDCPYPFHWAHCCHSSSTRTLSELPGFTFAQNGDVLDSVIFCDLEANVTRCGHAVKITETSAYPAAGGAVYTFACDAPVEFTFRILIPEFCRTASVCVNGQAVCAVPGSFAAIRRVFRSGDSIRVDFDLPAQLIFGRGESEGCVAVQYGPLVLAVDERFGVAPEDVELLIDGQGSVTLTPAALPQQDPVCVLFETDALVKGVPGRVKLVDFVHAGGYHQTRFRIWQRCRRRA